MIGPKVRLIALIEHIVIKTLEEATSKWFLMLVLLAISTRKDVVHLSKGSPATENVLKWIIASKYPVEEVILLTLTTLIEREI